MNVHNLCKHEITSSFLQFFSLKECSGSVVSLYKGLVELLPAPITSKNLLAWLTVLDNLYEVFGCSIVTDFI